MIKLSRRTVLVGLATVPPASARAQTADFPDRPLRLVVGFPPGGPNDLLARLIAPGIGDRLKRTVVVENRAGANGEIAAASVAKAPAEAPLSLPGFARASTSNSATFAAGRSLRTTSSIGLMPTGATATKSVRMS